MHSWLVLPLLALPLVALGADPVTQATTDLDGDGKPEKVTLQQGKDGAFTLMAGPVSVRGQVTTEAGGNDIHGFTVEDIDSSDKRREVLVHTTGELDEHHRVVFYAYDGKRFTELGKLSSAGEIRGNGIVLVEEWAGFWQRRDKYVLDAKKGQLRKVEQDVYWVGKEATVKKSFPLQRSRTDSSVVANLAPDTKVLVVAAAPPSASGATDWYLIKSSTGLMGWARLEPGSELVEGLSWAG
jgi:hypothetical protein